MAGLGNKVFFGEGLRLQPTSADSLLGMQQLSTDVGAINHTGDPEGVVSANPSSICHDPVSGVVYVKQSGTGNTGWAALSPPTGIPQVTIKSPDVDFLTVANTTIFTPAADFIVTGYGFYAKTLSGTIGAPVVNFGTNAATYDNYANNITSSSTQGNFLYFTNGNDLPAVPSGTPLIVRVSVGDLTATTNTQVFYVTGFYL